MAKETLPTLRSAELNYLITLYRNQPRTSDDLPYTPEMEQIVRAFDRKFRSLRLTRRQLFLLLVRIRKAGGLPRKRKAK